MAVKTETRWVIVYKQGLYTGQWLTRKDAIEEHTRDKGKTWAECRKFGDRAVRAGLVWDDPHAS
jgi:hypothetical protein